MFCPKCGVTVGDGDSFCGKCGYNLQQKTVVVEVDQGLGKCFPKNTAAVTAYYLGVFSLFCFLISIPAVIFGILGLIHAKEKPELRGVYHAWFGIISGSIGTVLWIVLLFTIFVAMSNAT